MGMKSAQMHEDCIQNVEEFFMDRVMELVDKLQLEDADAIHEEFMVEDESTEEWLFINDMTNE
jgi:trans-2-enoyl-CoA reductase